MNSHHHAFINHYLVHEDKEEAYDFAYPNAKESSRQNAANRLLQHPEIKEYIDQRIARIDARVNEKVEAKRLQQALDLEEAKDLLTSIIRGQHITHRNVKVKNGFEAIDVYPSHAQILRALNMFLKLADLWPKAERKKQGERAEEKEEDEEFDNYWITIGDKPFDPVEGTKYAQWYPLYYAGILWNPTKPNERAGWQKYMNTLSEEERAPFLENVRRWDEEQEQMLKNGHSHSPSLRGTKQSSHAMDSPTSGLDCHVAGPPRNDGIKINDGAIQQQKTTTSLMSTLEKDEYEKRITANCQPSTANCEKDYISIQEAHAISLEKRKTDTTNRSLVCCNILEKLVRTRKPMNRFRQTLLEEAGWQLHPTDITKVKAVKPTMDTITEPPPPKPYIMPVRPKQPKQQWWLR